MMKKKEEEEEKDKRKEKSEKRRKERKRVDRPPGTQALQAAVTASFPLPSDGLARAIIITIII